MTQTNEYIDYPYIAEKLLSRIGESEFFNGMVEHSHQSRTSILKCTLIIYREKTLSPDDPVKERKHISDIVPVWWEYHTFDEQSELVNDFSWHELKEYLL